jgi:hypothetical protein
MILLYFLYIILSFIFYLIINTCATIRFLCNYDEIQKNEINTD